MTETQRIDNILAGNTNEFGKLVERYLPMVRGLCRSHVYDPSAEEDLVQDSLLEGFRKLPTLRNRERFGPWLAAITRNKCKNWLRRQSRKARAYEAVGHEEARKTVAEPMGIVARRELYDYVRDRIGDLPTKTREAMLLHYVEGLSIAESAAFLGISETAVKQRLFYGRNRIGERLWDELGDKSERARDTAGLESRVMASLPAEPLAPPSTGLPWPIPVTVLVAVVAVAAIALLPDRSAPGTAALTATPVLPEAPRLHIVYENLDGGPLDALENQLVRIAPQGFNRDAFNFMLLEMGIPPRLGDELANNFTTLPSPQGYMNMDAGGLSADAAAALDGLAGDVQSMPMDAVLGIYRSFLPTPDPAAWTEHTTDDNGYLSLADLEPGIYTLRIGPEPTIALPPWIDRNLVRMTITEDIADDTILFLPLPAP